MNHISSNSKKHWKSIGLPLLAVFLLLAGCTPYYQFQVDSIADKSVGLGESFIVVSGNPDLHEGNLRFIEAKNYVVKAMEGKGFYESRSLQNADMILEINFGVGDPREVLDVTHYPQTYWTHGRSYSVSVPVRNANGKVIGFERRIFREPSRSYTHWEERIQRVTLYDKSLELKAFDNRTGNSVQAAELWGVNVRNTDTSPDLRYYLPLMLAAAIPYIGENTGVIQTVQLTDTDPEVLFLREPS